MQWANVCYVGVDFWLNCRNPFDEAGDVAKGNPGGIQQGLAGDRRHQNGWHMATHTHIHM